jgi:cell division protein FtsB
MNKLSEGIPPSKYDEVLRMGVLDATNRIKQLEDQVKSLTIQKHGWHDWEDPDWGKKYALKQAYQTLSDENRQLRGENKKLASRLKDAEYSFIKIKNEFVEKVVVD